MLAYLNKALEISALKKSPTKQTKPKTWKIDLKKYSTVPLDEDWYPREKVEIARLKLLGAHPGYLISEELKLNQRVYKQTKLYDAACNHILDGQIACSAKRLSVDEQCTALIAQASNINLIARQFHGWQDF